MSYSAIAKQRLQSWRRETPAVRTARLAQEQPRRQERARERARRTRGAKEAAAKLDEWYREQGKL